MEIACSTVNAKRNLPSSVRIVVAPYIKSLVAKDFTLCKRSQVQQNAADGTPLPTDGVMKDKSNECSRSPPRQSPCKVAVNKK